MTLPPIEVIMSFLRQALIFGGGLLVGQGFLTADQLQAVTGFIMTVIPAVWGLAAKWNDTAKIQTLVDDKKELKAELRQAKNTDDPSAPIGGVPGGY